MSTIKLIPKAQIGIQFPSYSNRIRKAVLNTINKQVGNQLRNQVLGINTDSRLNPNSPILKSDTRSTAQRQRDYNRSVQLEVKQKANELAASFGRALGANHNMTVDEVNENTLNTANLMGYIAAPYLMTALESGYYGATGRPKEAAITAGVGFGLPIVAKSVVQMTKKLPNAVRSAVTHEPVLNNYSIYKSAPEDQTRFILDQIADPSLLGFKTSNYSNPLYQSGVDYVERGISPEVRSIVETQIKPRLLTDDTRFYLAERDPSYARDFNNAINETVNSTEISEWSRKMMEDYNRVHNTDWGGFSFSNKPRVIISKLSNMPISTTETHELRHLLQRSVPRTPTEQNVLKEAYGDVPLLIKGDGSIDASYDMSKEWETMNTEARKILLEKAGYKYDVTKSLEENVIEQDRILENYKNSDLVKALRDNADGYWADFIDKFQSKSSGEKRAKVAAWKKAMQLVGMGTGVITAPKLINRE